MQQIFSPQTPERNCKSVFSTIVLILQNKKTIYCGWFEMNYYRVKLEYKSSPNNLLIHFRITVLFGVSLQSNRSYLDF